MSAPSPWPSWLADYTPTIPVEAWLHALLWMDAPQLDEVQRNYPLEPEAQDELRRLLAQRGDDATTRRALDHALGRLDWPDDWVVTTWGLSSSKPLLCPSDLGVMLDWWVTTHSSHDPVPALNKALAAVLSVILKNKPNPQHRTWECLATIAAHLPGWSVEHGLSGRWAALVLSLCPGLAHQSISDDTQKWTADDYVIAYRCLINMENATSSVWGIDRSSHLASQKWDQWECWLDAAPLRRTTWQALLDDDRHVVSVERAWLTKIMPDKWEGSSLSAWASSNRATYPEVLDHAYFGDLASAQWVQPAAWDHLKRTLCGLNKEPVVPIHKERIRRIVVRWVVSQIREDVLDVKAAAFFKSPAGRHLACAPRLLDIGLHCGASWVSEVLFHSRAGVEDLLACMLADYRANDLALARFGEECLIVLLTTHSDHVRAWRDKFGCNLLQAWYEYHRPQTLKVTLLEQVSLLAPEWLVSPFPGSSTTMLDMPVNDDVRFADLRRRLLADHAIGSRSMELAGQLQEERRI